MIEVDKYFTSKLAEHGESALGVDYNGEESQTLRFELLSKIIDSPDHFSINDLGCGYGAFNDFLFKRYSSFSYCGIDLCESMIKAAEKRYSNDTQTRFLHSTEPDQIADYGVASGIFNLKLGRSDNECRTDLQAILDILNLTSKAGFAFNCLTSYSDADKMRNDLYYADPCDFFDLCKRRYSKNVALLHDYNLYDFTILVRK